MSRISWKRNVLESYSTLKLPYSYTTCPRPTPNSSRPLLNVSSNEVSSARNIGLWKVSTLTAGTDADFLGPPGNIVGHSQSIRDYPEPAKVMLGQPHGIEARLLGILDLLYGFSQSFTLMAGAFLRPGREDEQAKLHVVDNSSIDAVGGNFGDVDHLETGAILAIRGWARQVRMVCFNPCAGR